MKVNKKFVEEVANGKYSDYDTHGEMQESARRILENKVVSKFSTFCFQVFGGELMDNVMDIYDAFVDFAIHGAEINIKVPADVHPSGKWQVFGMTPEESLENLWSDACRDERLFDSARRSNFKIRGEKGVFCFKPVVLHSVYDKGRYHPKKAVEFCRVS